jgi:hypothetical protein
LVFTAKGGVHGQGEEDLGMVDGGKKSQRKWGFGGEDRPETS